MRFFRKSKNKSIVDFVLPDCDGSGREIKLEVSTLVAKCFNIRRTNIYKTRRMLGEKHTNQELDRMTLISYKIHSVDCCDEPVQSSELSKAVLTHEITNVKESIRLLSLANSLGISSNKEKNVKKIEKLTDRKNALEKELTFCI